MTSGLVDLSIANEFVDIQKILKPQLSIEVGAFDAEFSLMMLDKKICENIYAYEASKDVYNKFKASLSGIDYTNLAITNYSGTATLEIDPDVNASDNGSNGIKNKREVKKYNYLDVECNSLDNLHTSDETNCLWIDVEGANKEVLLGAEKLLENTDSLFIETETHNYWQEQWLHNDVVNYLAKYNLTFYKWQKQHTSQYNCIFIKDDLISLIS
jgi:FkbM family methyltransferase